MSVSIRLFQRDDVPAKVRWINDPANNRFLHYDLPLTEDGTYRWFDAIQGRNDRLDCTIELDGVPVGVIGLLSIDRLNHKAEYYITLGEQAARGRGVATEATRLLLEQAFRGLGLDRVYLYTERENTAAQRLFERSGFRREGMLLGDMIYRGRSVDRFVYAVSRWDYLGIQERTPILPLCSIDRNQVWIKRDDLIPFSFGGNKARKAELFFQEVDKGGYDHVVTYGSGHSNHCRVVANCCAARGIGCTVIAPQEASDPTFNSMLVQTCDASTVTVPVDQVHDTIERVLDDLRASGMKPFFIPGGGHGNTGTQAYVDCYEEILLFERQIGWQFDEIYLASGTGTTQAGLVCGMLLHRDNRRIVGISVARQNPRGRNVVVDSVRDYLSSKAAAITEESIQDAVVFLDEYVGDGYASSSPELTKLIREAYVLHGLPLDRTYTGKAFFGMRSELLRSDETAKRVLFVHTGGTPLFFDELSMMPKVEGMA